MPARACWRISDTALEQGSEGRARPRIVRSHCLAGDDRLERARCHGPRAAGPVPHDVAHPRLRGRRRAGQPGWRRRLRPGRRRASGGAWPAAPVHRPGGGGRGRVRAASPQRLPHQHAPRPRPHAGQGRRPRAHAARTVRQGHRLLRWARWLDAHCRLLGRHARRQRRGRRRHPDRRGRGALDPHPRRRGDCRELLRRRRHQSRAFRRRAELGGRLRAAGALRLRGQPVVRHHQDRRAVGRRRRRRTRPRARCAGAGGGRQRHRGGVPRCAHAGRRGARRRRSAAAARDAPTASRATCRWTRPPTATRPNCRRRWPTTRCSVRANACWRAASVSRNWMP